MTTTYCHGYKIRYDPDVLEKIRLTNPKLVGTRASSIISLDFYSYQPLTDEETFDLDQKVAQIFTCNKEYAVIEKEESAKEEFSSTRKVKLPWKADVKVLSWETDA